MTVIDRRKERKKRATPTPVVGNPDPEARKRAAAVLEVMGGLATPVAAAKANGMSLPRYYALEKRALEGLVAACATTRRKGRQVTPAREIERLRAQVARLEREASRNLAMVRATQRAAGFSPPSPSAMSSATSVKAGKAGGTVSVKARKRRPMARALAVAESLRGPSGPTAAEAAKPPAPAVPAPILSPGVAP